LPTCPPGGGRPKAGCDGGEIAAARTELCERGVDVSDARHLGADGWTPGPDPDRRDYVSIADFSDPDGNTWTLQERGHEPLA
jgi:hypothetical protein